MSPIGLHHVSLTHPKTPINRSLPKAFGGRPEDLEVQKLCKNQASKPSRISTPKSKNTRSRIIQTIYLDPNFYGNQAQMFENINKPQIGEALRIQASKVLENFHHKPSKTKNTKNKEFLTSSQPEIHCNSILAIFDLSLNQIEGYFVFKSKSHYHKSNQ